MQTAVQPKKKKKKGPDGGAVNTLLPELMEGSQTKQGLGQRGYGGVGVRVPVSATHKPPRAPLTPWSHALPPNTLSVSPNRHSQGTYTVLGLAPGTQLSPELPESHHNDKQQQSWLGGRE